MPTILLVEREAGHNPSLASSLRARSVAVVMENDFHSAIANIAVHEPDLVVLDSAYMRTSHVRMAHQLIQASDGVPLIRVAPAETAPTHIHENEFLIIIQPFSLRQLTTLATRLLPPDPEDELSIGPIRVDKKSRTVRSQRPVRLADS